MKIKQLVMAIFILGSSYCYGKTASYYAEPFHGRVTASGYIYNKNQMTCASNVHKFGTVLKVTNKANQKSVIVVVTDTGSFDRKYGRSIDLSEAAFKKLDKLGKGLLKVHIEVLNRNNTFRYKHGKPAFRYSDYVKGG